MQYLVQQRSTFRIGGETSLDFFRMFWRTFEEHTQREGAISIGDCICVCVCVNLM